MEDKTIETLKKLWHDYLELAESYQDELTIPEFGFGLVKFVSKIFFDTAPSKVVAIEVLRIGIIEGMEWSEQEKVNA